MSSTTSPGSLRFALVAASALTVVVAVGADLLSGSHPAHTAAIGAASVALGTLRVRLAGSFRGVFGLVSAAVVTQPVAYAVMDLSGGVARPGHLLTVDATESVLPLLVTVATVVAVGVAESAIEMAAIGLLAWRGALLRLLTRPTRSTTTSSVPPVDRAPSPRPSNWRPFAVRRGPPPTVVA